MQIIILKIYLNCKLDLNRLDLSIFLKQIIKLLHLYRYNSRGLTRDRDTSVDQIPSMKNKLFIIYYYLYNGIHWNLNCTILITN